MVQIAEWMNQIVTNIEDKELRKGIAREVRAFCAGFPAPGLETEPAVA